jgi:hypothetical protein
MNEEEESQEKLILLIFSTCCRHLNIHHFYAAPAQAPTVRIS